MFQEIRHGSHEEQHLVVAFNAGTLRYSWHVLWSYCYTLGMSYGVIVTRLACIQQVSWEALLIPETVPGRKRLGFFNTAATGKLL